MELLAKRKEIVSLLMQQNILVSREVLDRLKKPETVDEWHEKLTNGVPYDQLTKKEDGEETRTGLTEPNVEILKNYTKPVLRKSIQDFVAYYTSRYKQMNKLLQQRSELQNLTSITRVLGKTDSEKVSVIAYITDKNLTKNGNIILKLEDDTGRMTAIVTKNKPDVFDIAKDLTLDQVVGFTGTGSKDAIFVNSIVTPDIPLTHEFKKSDEDARAIVLSDIHVGSTLFMEKEFQSFIRWIRGEEGNQTQREQANKVKYVFIAGDLVEGVGIYPNQDKELNIKDIYEQYDKVAEYLEQIPKDKKIIAIPGNHDAGRISEPQLPLNKDFAKSLYRLPNLISLSNPSMVRIHTTKQTPGFDFLIYHGYSYDFYGDVVESIRGSGKNISDRVGPIMKYLIQQRHLAPTHGSTLIVPDKEEDPLVVDQIPDFFISGHIHKVALDTHRGISLISGSCWQAKTPFQEKVGHEPEPCKVPIINLQTRNITLLDFNQK